jgi:hypothetical protein
MAQQQTRTKAQAAIAYHAAECLKALELAAFAEHEPLYLDGAGMATSLRKLAAYSAEQAFAWVPKLAVSP